MAEIRRVSPLPFSFGRRRPRRRHSRARRALLAALLCALAAAPAAAQAQTPGAASPFLPPDHWAVEAVRTLHAAGFLPAGLDRGTRTLTRLEAGALLRAALERSAVEVPGTETLARAWAARFGVEFPEVDARLDGARPGAAFTTGWADFSYSRREGQLAPGAHADYDEESWTGPTPLPDGTRSRSALHLAGDLFPHLAAVVEPFQVSGDWDLASAYVTGAWRGLGAWAGRRTSGFGAGEGRGVVLNPVTSFDGGGLFLPRPLALPVLGPVRGELFLSRIADNGPMDDVWLFGTRATVTPHPRVGLGVSRAGMVAAAEGGLGVADLLYVLVGGHAGGSQFDNQVAALDAWWRLPVPAVPLLASVEWGFDDSAGAIVDVPGIVAALEVPVVPGLPVLALRIEHARFEGSCCSNPPWYRHSLGFHEGWTTEGLPLGHRLGGHGTEWTGEARASLMDARALVRAQLFARERGAENLFAPDREGASTGALLRADVQVAPRTQVLVEGEVEEGDGWRAWVGRVTGRMSF